MCVVRCSECEYWIVEHRFPMFRRHKWFFPLTRAKPLFGHAQKHIYILSISLFINVHVSARICALHTSAMHQHIVHQLFHYFSSRYLISYFSISLPSGFVILVSSLIVFHLKLALSWFKRNVKLHYYKGDNVARYRLSLFKLESRTFRFMGVQNISTKSYLAKTFFVCRSRWCRSFVHFIMRNRNKLVFQRLCV